MSVESWIAILSALVGGGGLIGSLLLLPRIRAEARKLNAETDGLIVTRLYAEIERLDRELGEVRDQFGALRKAAASEKAELERENRELHAKIIRLEVRIKAMEMVLAEVFKVDPNSAEFNDLLIRIDEAEKTMRRRA